MSAPKIFPAGTARRVQWKQALQEGLPPGVRRCWNACSDEWVLAAVMELADGRCVAVYHEAGQQKATAVPREGLEQAKELVKTVLSEKAIFSRLW